ncbi:hypothetical protein UR09_06250 [Candidatus Nitromaritima sp. SCGC AAA799-A02]|nr:hypothetical protein UR09_06250 [Candidatus Nitromaritima sp. SCGC AAA799-A02]
MKLRWVIVFALAFILPLAGCGYHLAGYGSALPPHIRTIAIPVFENSSSEPDIHREATSAVRQAFITDGRLKVVKSKRADLLLRATLTYYSLRAVAFSGDDSAEQYIVQLGVHVEALDRVKRKVFLEQDFTTQWDYKASADVIDSESARFAALDQAYDDLADRLVSIIIEQF